MWRSNIVLQKKTIIIMLDMHMPRALANFAVVCVCPMYACEHMRHECLAFCMHTHTYKDDDDDDDRTKGIAFYSFLN